MTQWVAVGTALLASSCVVRQDAPATPPPAPAPANATAPRPAAAPANAQAPRPAAAPSASLAGAWRGCDDRTVVFTKDGDEWICTIEIPGGLAAYGFRRGEVGCRFKQVGPGRYEGEILWRDRAGNASWKHTVATVTGDTYEDTTGHDECTRYWRRLHGEFVTAELVGFWTGDWGDMVLREVGDEVWGAYRHDDGTVVLRWDADDVLRGWWSEAPSRNPDQDAGEVEFRFARDGDAIVLDGRWRYGTSGAWREDWDLRRSPQAPPADLESRFAHPELFKRRP